MHGIAHRPLPSLLPVVPTRSFTFFKSVKGGGGGGEKEEEEGNGNCTPP